MCPYHVPGCFSQPSATSYMPHNSPGGRYQRPLFADEEAEAQRGTKAPPATAELGSKPGRPSSLNLLSFHHMSPRLSTKRRLSWPSFLPGTRLLRKRGEPQRAEISLGSHRALPRKRGADALASRHQRALWAQEGATTAALRGPLPEVWGT